ncbi:MAG: hypothetical protein WCF04_01655 [Candidatus Nanopelagicales bacterium]
MPHRSLAEQIHAGFPGAVPVGAFVSAWADRCAEHGFVADNSLLLVGVCRDEVCFPFVAQVEDVWGPAFHMDSLGGLVTIGRTGISAAGHHAPEDPGQPLRYVVVASAHIGMDATGGFGYLRRSHQATASRTCGALMAFRDELLTSHLHLGYDPVDPEMSLLRQRILSALIYGEVPDPVDLTGIVAGIIDADLRDLMAWYAEELADAHEARCATVTGILIHTASGDWFQPRAPRIWSSATGEQPVDLDVGARGRG